MTTAWVLRGGASFGAVQVGMAQALMEAGHHPDMLYGASAGALNAAWLAADPTPQGLASLSKLWRTVRRRDVFPMRPWDIVAGLAGLSDHTLSNGPLRKWLRTTALLRRLDDGVLPLTVVATDLETGEEVVLSTGPAVPALLATSAMPGLFPPVRLGGRWLVDGSIASDTPVGPAVASGARSVWVLECVPSGPTARPRAALDVLLRSSSIMLARHNAATVTAWAGRCELYVVPPPLLPGVSPFDFGRSEELIDAAYRLTCTWLPNARPVEPCGLGGPARPDRSDRPDGTGRSGTRSQQASSSDQPLSAGPGVEE
jgi:NTE family protein